jgi:hypothetical protein
LLSTVYTEIIISEPKLELLQHLTSLEPACRRLHLISQYYPEEEFTHTTGFTESSANPMVVNMPTTSNLPPAKPEDDLSLLGDVSPHYIHKQHITEKFLNSKGLVPIDRPVYVSMAVNPTSGQSVDVQIEDLKNNTLKKVERMHNYETIFDVHLDLRVLSRVWKSYNSQMESFDALVLPDLKGVLAKYSYELDQDGEASPDNVTFRIRTKDYSTEFDRLLVFLQHIECPILEKIRRKMIGLSEEVVLKKGLVTDLLYELALEGTNTERPLNTLSQWMYTSVILCWNSGGLLLVWTSPKFRSGRRFNCN